MRTLVTALTMSILISNGAAADTLRLYAAGSLKAAMGDIATAYAERAGASKVELVLGPSGLLRERIEKGEAAHVFASADTGHPKRLAEQGKTVSPPRVFARNQLCALVRDGVKAETATLLDTLLDPAVKLGTSTPKADPSGDYAFQLFGKAEALKAGAKAALEAKALTLTGGPTSEKPPEGRNSYAWVVSSGKADVFLTYCTNALVAKAEVPALSIVAVPAALAVGADYGLVVLKDAPAEAAALADFIVSSDGRAVLAKHGFGPGD